jgi:uncharacterized protein (TIGR02466 family)
MQETHLFYSPLWQEDLAATSVDWPARRAAMLARIDQLEHQGGGVEKTNFGGWQSDDELYVHAEFGWLIDHIMRLSNQIAPNFSPALRFNTGHLWANVNRRGHFNAMHTHPNSILSGVAYLEVESADQGLLQFFDCREGNPTTHWQCYAPLDERTALTEETYSVKPREGLILFFPSWLRHWVTPNTTDTRRVSVAFNVRSG